MTREADGGKQLDASHGSVLSSGQLDESTPLRGVLEMIASHESVRFGVLRILSKEVRGHIGFEGKVITGAHVTSTREYGRSALRKLVSINRGMFGFLSLPATPVELRQSMKLEMGELLNWRRPGASEPPPLEEAVEALLGSLHAGTEMSGFNAEQAGESQLVQETEAQFATYMAWGGEVPVLSSNLASMSSLLAPRKGERKPEIERIPQVPDQLTKPQVAAPGAAGSAPPVSAPAGYSMHELNSIPTPQSESGPIGTPLSAMKRLSDVAARITGQHSTLRGRAGGGTNIRPPIPPLNPPVESKTLGAPASQPGATSQSQAQAQAISETQANVRGTAERLKAAAAMGVDLTTASQRLRAMSNEHPKIPLAAKIRMQVKSEEDDDEDPEYEPPVRQVKALGMDALLGGAAFAILLVIFAYQCFQAFKYRDSVGAGTTALRDGKLDEAVVDFTSSLSANPSATNVYFLRALAETRQNNFKDALKDYEKAIERDSNNPKLYTARASLYNKMKKYDEAVNDCDAVLGHDANYAEAHRLRANALNHLGRYPEALTDCAQFLKGHKQNDPQKADVLANRAYALFQSKSYDACIKDYSAAIECDPSNGVLYASRAVAYQQVKDWKKAIDDCKVALDLMPSDTTVLKVRGLCYAGLGMSEDSLQDLDKLVKLKSSVETHRMRGDARLLVHDYEGAMEDFDYVLGARPHDQDVRSKYERARAGLQGTAKVITVVADEMNNAPKKKSAVNLNQPEPQLVKKGYDLMRSGDADQATEYLSAAIKANPNDGSARRYLAYALVEAGANEEAAAQFIALAKAQPLAPADQMMYAKALDASGKKPEAIGVYSGILASDPKNDNARIELIKAYISAGHKEQAQKIAEEGVRTSPAAAANFMDLIKSPSGK